MHKRGVPDTRLKRLIGSRPTRNKYNSCIIKLSLSFSFRLSSLLSVCRLALYVRLCPSLNLCLCHFKQHIHCSVWGGEFKYYYLNNALTCYPRKPHRFTAMTAAIAVRLWQWHNSSNRISGMVMIAAIAVRYSDDSSNRSPLTAISSPIAIHLLRWLQQSQYAYGDGTSNRRPLTAITAVIAIHLLQLLPDDAEWSCSRTVVANDHDDTDFTRD